MSTIRTVASATLCLALLGGCESGTMPEMPAMPDLSGVGDSIVKFGDRLAGAFGSGGGLAKANQASPSGSEFSKGLYEGYLQLAKDEYAEGDYGDSDVFADYAMKAAVGQDTQPEELSKRRIPEGAVGELTQSRERLMRSLAGGARDKAPADAAKAQVMFDCWMQEQEENFQPADIARCKSGFMTAMTAVDGTLAAGRGSMSKKYVVYFPTNSAKLTPASMRLVEQAIDDAKQTGGAKIMLTAHTDTAGNARYNQALSGKRALAVVDALKQGGIAESALDWKSVGENNLAVATKDNVSDARNRRVEMVIVK